MIVFFIIDEQIFLGFYPHLYKVNEINFYSNLLWFNHLSFY